MKKYRKSFYGVTAIMVSIAIFLFVIVIVLSFFYFFKFQITLVIKDQYLWNKIQEVPLDLLSMSLGKESFVSKMNKVYYLGDEEEKTELREIVDGNISKQLFYFLGETQYPLSFVININGISITKYLEGCGCTDCYDVGTWRYCSCSNLCPEGRRGELCSSGPFKKSPTAKEHNWCRIYGVKTEYSAEFPFPLTFNGTDKFVDEMSYEVVEER